MSPGVFADRETGMDRGIHTRNEMKWTRSIVTGLLWLAGTLSFSQEKPQFTIYGGLQFWLRYTELNPGSSVGAGQYDQTFDLSVRRYRLGIKGNVSPYFEYNLVLGNNNLSRYQRDQPPKLLDAYVSHRTSDKLIITGGKHGWTGLSRYASPGVFGAMGADINFSANPTLNVHDDIFRRLGLALHGQFEKWDYRLVFSKPFANKDQPPLSSRPVLTDNPTSLSISAYVKYQLWDKEPNVAFTPWTYLGEKAILNFGAGFTHQGFATESLTVDQDTLRHRMLSFAADVFCEIPSGNNAFTVYMAWYRHDLGPGFLRYIGANNPASGGVNALTLNGVGNSFPEAGTGHILMGQAGILKRMEKHGFQPNFMMEVANFEALDDLMILWEAGANYLIDGHRSKISFTYQSRPLFVEAENGPKESDRKGMMVVQYQLSF